MDESEFLRILRDDPDNDRVREEYWKWLEAVGDHRSDCVRILRRQQALREELDQITSQTPQLIDNLDDEWLNSAFPLRLRSPLVGRVYLTPSPSAEPFVRIGDCVTPEKVVCLIESMKLFSEVVAGVSGFVTEIVVENGSAVKSNQVLIRFAHNTIQRWCDMWK